MSSYKKNISFLFLICCFIISCSNNNLNLKAQENKNFKKEEIKEFDLENLYIMHALELENQRAYFQAKNYYKKLFEKTNNSEYLNRVTDLCVLLRDSKSVIDIFDDSLFKKLENSKYEQKILKNYVISLISLKKHDEALNTVNKLLDIEKSAGNYKLLGKVYHDKKEYKKAYTQLEKSYKLENSASTMYLLAKIDYFDLNKKKKAIELLENYLENYDDTYNLSLQLLSMYEMQKQDKKALSLLKKIYKKYKNDRVLNGRLDNLMIKYLAKKDINEAISFAEENLGKNYDLLLTLYQIGKKNNKYINLLNKAFKEKNEHKYLAEIAIYEFEKAEDKQIVLDSVIKKFKQAIQKKSNDKYENYLAYLLIDYDKDINYGLTLVKKALKKQPENLAYIDTLAWGEYKINNCKKAYSLMKKVVDKLGLEDKEIKLHWEKIKECAK